MSEIKNRSYRFDEENDAWIRGLPGKSMNAAMTTVREKYEQETGFGAGEAEILEILELVRSLPDIEGVKEAVLEGIREFKAEVRKPISLPASGDPEEIPGVVRGVGNLPRRESPLERLQRERKEREMAARGRSSIGDDPSFSVDPEFVQD